MIRTSLLAAVTSLLLAGCGDKTPVYDDKTIQAAGQFGKIAAAYKEAYQRNRKPPASAEDLKPFLKRHGDPDALLTSLIDGKQVVIVPGPPPDTPAEEGEKPIIAYEQNGAGGKRMTVDTRGTIVFYTNAEFARIKFPGGHKPGAR